MAPCQRRGGLEDLLGNYIRQRVGIRNDLNKGGHDFKLTTSPALISLAAAAERSGVNILRRPS